MSEMSHDYGEHTPPARIELSDYKEAAYLADRLIQSGMWFECIPNPEGQRCMFRISPDNRKYAEQQLQEKNKVLHVNYKGHSVRCYGEMHPDQSTWWATEEDEGILPNGFDSWANAVVYFIDSERPIVELAAV